MTTMGGAAVSWRTAHATPALDRAGAIIVRHLRPALATAPRRRRHALEEQSIVRPIARLRCASSGATACGHVKSAAGLSLSGYSQQHESVKSSMAVTTRTHPCLRCAANAVSCRLGKHTAPQTYCGRCARTKALMRCV